MMGDPVRYFIKLSWSSIQTMVKRKAPSRKVKAVKRPDGDEGKDLALQEKKERLAVMLTQFDEEGKQTGRWYRTHWSEDNEFRI